MICKEKWKRALVFLSAALSLTALAVPATAGAAPKYPDLRTLTPGTPRLGAAYVNGEHHYVVRFTNTIWNAGEGPFELHGTPHFPFDGLFDADQWIYDDAGLEIQRVGSFAFHPSHQHFHFDGFARYELWRQRDFSRAEAKGFTEGTPLYTSPKVSFCILDITRVDRTRGPENRFYQTCSPVMEGLSVGWGDVYSYTLPDQWVDVGETPLPDGEYVIRSIADPGNIVYESAGRADSARENQLVNSAARSFSIVNGRVAATL